MYATRNVRRAPMARQSGRDLSLLRVVLLLAALVIQALVGGAAYGQPVDALREQAAQLSRQGRHPEALSLYRTVLEHREKALGPEHPETANALHDVAVTHLALGQFAEAVPLHHRALAIREKAFGPAHPDTAKSLDALANLLRIQGKAAEALPLVERALEIREKALGAEHPDTASSLNTLGVVLRAQGQPTQALPLYQRALAIREKALGPEHPDTAQSLHNLAGPFLDRGQYAEALQLYSRALAIHEKVSGAEHPDTAQSLHSVATCYLLQGRHAEAQSAGERALAIREKALGGEHPDTAESMNLLASIQWTQGRHAEALVLFQRALPIREKTLGPEHPATAHTVQLLGGLHLERGQLAEAVALQERALAITEKTLGPQHPTTANNMSIVAFAYGKQGRFADAVPLAERALAIQEKTFGLEHPRIAVTLNILADLFRGQGRYGVALPLYERALALQEKFAGPNHASTAFSLSTLGKLHAAQGRFEDALPLFRRVLTIREKALGPNHPDVAWAIDDIVSVYREGGGKASNVPGSTALPFDDALALMRRATAIRRSRGSEVGRGDADRNDASSRSERQLARSGFLAHVRLLAASGGARDPLAGAATESFEVAQLARASDTASAVAQMAARFASGNDELAATVRNRQDRVLRLRFLDGELLKALSRTGPGRDDAAIDRMQSEIRDVESQLVHINADLDRRFPDYQILTAHAPLPLREAQALLRPGEALLSYLIGEEESYLWVVRKDRQKFLRLAIGRNELDAAVRRLRRTLDLTESQRRLQPYRTDLAYELYRNLVAPATPLLAGIRQLMVVPDGPLQSLPLAVLIAERPSKDGDLSGMAWLAKRYAFSTLPSEGSLKALRRFAGKRSAPDPFVGFGNPAFKGSPGGPRALAARYSPRGLADVEELSQLPALPDSAQEIAAMAVALGAGPEAIFLGPAATETEVKRLDLARYRTMAFATHGFTAGEIGGAVEPALALTPPSIASDDDDGLLTASEIARLRLNADWVILSACNTAAPDGSVAAEGLSGLARAFIFAGSRSLLVSHWPVDSRATAMLTTRMLNEIRQHPGMRKDEALRRAMLSMIASKTYGHPLFWAPFVIVGA